MRQVDYDTGSMLRDKQTGTIDNRTRISLIEGWYTVLLWDNPIARYNGNVLEIDSCGYHTLTTTNRLNGILNAMCGGVIKRKSGKFYLNGEEWDGCTKKIDL